ncbi:MAG: hypothetical protein EOS72_20615 [Mesorhizobium sp.]|uniref:hypothetical protein n=1 Tax=Mesorhizobium sp. TaxID=1871066 RepID=UPI000FE49E1D|nr:hypothetical protein [Mesorhizobium sp.]RWC87651.1 MAG: hypothetical protein EOS72_20615 [Mesorhizobium sp.]
MSATGGEAQHPASASDDISLWRTLAAAGPKATAEALSDQDFDRMHIASGVESFLAARVQAGQSIVLTGNAGDGKTHLLRRMKPALESTGAVVVEDATALMRAGRVEPILDRWQQAIEAQRPFCIAANEYPLYQLRIADKESSHMVEVSRQCRHRLAYGRPTIDEDANGLLVVDLSLRNPLSASFIDAMIDKLLGDAALNKAVIGSSEPVARRNFELLSLPRVRGRLRALADRLIALGYRATVRELWILVSRMVFGRLGRGDFERSDWYSEALFAHDERFDATIALRAVDPTGSSHPYWDGALELRSEPVRSGWAQRQPLASPHPTLEWADFAALKRRFYFEHERGQEVFELADSDASEFQALLQGQRVSGPGLVAKLVEAINAAYCPVRFDSRDQHLYLWNGHRFHEQPSRSFVAGDRIASEQFALEVPRLPMRLDGAFDYHPDHVVLTALGSRGKPRLRIDFPLWQTLRRLGRGLPRKLVPERDIHRLDAFLEKLGAELNGERHTIWSAHLENLELIQVNLSMDGRRFEGVRIYD